MLEYMKIDADACKVNPADVLDDLAQDARELELLTSAVAMQGEEHTRIEPAQVWHISSHLHAMAEALAHVADALEDGGSLATATGTEAQK